MPIPTRPKPIPKKAKLISNAGLVIRTFSECLNMSVFGVIWLTRYIPRVVFNLVMILATSGAVFFLSSTGTTSPSDGKKPDSKKNQDPNSKTTTENAGKVFQSSVLLLACISLINLVIYTLFDILKHNVSSESFFTAASFVTVSFFCVILTYLGIEANENMNRALPYIKMLIVVAFMVMVMLLYNVPTENVVYIPVSFMALFSLLFLQLPGFIAISHQYTVFSQVSKKADDRFCMTLGIILSGLFYSALGNLAYRFEGISSLLFGFVDTETTGSWVLLKYLGYNSGYGALFRLLFTLFCLVNFLGYYDKLRSSVFRNKKKENKLPDLAYGTVALSLLYYMVVFALSYFKITSFYMVVLYIPLYALYSIAYYFYPLANATVQKLGWRYTAVLALLVSFAFAVLCSLLSGITTYELVNFIPTMFLKIASVLTA